MPDGESQAEKSFQQVEEQNSTETLPSIIALGFVPCQAFFFLPNVSPTTSHLTNAMLSLLSSMYADTNLHHQIMMMVNNVRHRTPQIYVLYRVRYLRVSISTQVSSVPS